MCSAKPTSRQEVFRRQGLNFRLRTAAGDLDLLGEATGGGTYGALLPHTEVQQLLSLECRFADLETLIRLKRAAGRPKDFECIAELEVLWKERLSSLWKERLSSTNRAAAQTAFSL